MDNGIGATAPQRLSSGHRHEAGRLGTNMNVGFPLYSNQEQTVRLPLLCHSHTPRTKLGQECTEGRPDRKCLLV